MKNRFPLLATEGRFIKGKNSNCNTKTIFWHTELHEPFSQEARILQRTLGLNLKSISLFTNVFMCKLSLSLERCQASGSAGSRLMVVYNLVISKMKVKTAIGGNLLYEMAHG